MTRGWMVRAGNDNVLVEDFETKGIAAVGWGDIGAVTPTDTRDDVKGRVAAAHPDAGPQSVAGIAGQLYRFAREVDDGDWILSFDKSTREYLVGRAGSYRFDTNTISSEYPHIREVEWQGRVERDRLGSTARNSLGSSLTIFEATPWIDEIEALLTGKGIEEVQAEDEPEEAESYYRDVQEKARQMIIDRINRLDGYEFEALVAGTLRAMGYRTQENPRGPDGGVDIRASPDGAMLSDPIIRVQVKHRKDRAGASEIQQLVGAAGPGTRGLFVSTGGFSKDARREADRANIPVTLLDAEAFSDLLSEHYPQLDVEYRDLLPLGRVWVPLRA